MDVSKYIIRLAKVNKVKRYTMTNFLIRLFSSNILMKLIVTTSTTPKHQNKNEDGDSDAALRHVAVQVDDVTPL